MKQQLVRKSSAKYDVNSDSLLKIMIYLFSWAMNNFFKCEEQLILTVKIVFLFRFIN